MKPWKKDHTKVNLGGYLPASNVKYLVFHFVGARGQALDNANYFRDTYREASAHLFIDSKEVYEVVPLNRVAWHVGDGHNRFGINNNNAIGVELCQDVSNGADVWHWDFSAQTRKEAILVFAELMKRFNVPLERVVRHYDASRKLCPGNWQYDNWAKWWLWKKDLATYVKTGVLLDSQRGLNYSKGKDVKVVSVADKVAKIDVGTLAREVIKGLWGVGRDRVNRLTKAGYDAAVVQAKVDEILGKHKPVPTEVATVGTYRFEVDVNIRNKPVVREDTHSGYVYYKGDTVNIESVSVIDGITWGHYRSYSGKDRYVALENNGVRYAVKL